MGQNKSVCMCAVLMSRSKEVGLREQVEVLLWTGDRGWWGSVSSEPQVFVVGGQFGTVSAWAHIVSSPQNHVQRGFCLQEFYGWISTLLPLFFSLFFTLFKHARSFCKLYINMLLLKRKKENAMVCIFTIN